MNDGANVKQQIVERIKQSSNILVTVSRDPSVDELTSALGLTLMLNSLKKHATAVVSGQLPAAIDFLEPGKTFENTVDSLRDFIIALDKEKADHLRYKVDGDVVKIFITPYRTMINENDLEFSQGDYNVELVLALGVKSKDQLDSALESHGRILHDATVASLSAGEDTSKLGTLNWSETGASSISEMLVSLSEALKDDKPLLDEPIATAFLTGIVAATDRFSNNKTSSKVMTMAAQLMAAGANQQLIAAKLEEAHAISSEESPAAAQTEAGNSDGTTSLAEDTKSKIDKAVDEPAKETPDGNGGLSIRHDTETKLAAAEQAVEQQSGADAAEKAEDALASQLEAVAPAASNPTPSVDDLQNDLASASPEATEAAPEPSPAPIDTANSAVEVPMPDYEPTIGGTLNATTEQAAEDKRREALSTQNRTILSHDSAPAAPANEAPATNTGPVFTPPPFNAASQDNSAAAEPEMSPLMPPTVPELQAPSIEAPSAAPSETLADIDRNHRAPHDEARAAVEAAYNDAPFNPANNPIASVGAQPFGEAVSHDAVSPEVPAPVAPNTELPPAPDFTALPPPPPPAFGPPVPAQPEQLGQIFGEAPTPVAAAPESNDPGQFRIPGQS